MWYRIASEEFDHKKDWVERHQVEREGDKYVFYHGSRLSLDYLRKGSLLETTPDAARSWADTNTRNDRRRRIKIYRVLLDLDDFNTGFWASLTKDIEVGEK